MHPFKIFEMTCQLESIHLRGEPSTNYRLSITSYHIFFNRIIPLIKSSYLAKPISYRERNIYKMSCCIQTLWNTHAVSTNVSSFGVFSAPVRFFKNINFILFRMSWLCNHSFKNVHSNWIAFWDSCTFKTVWHLLWLFFTYLWIQHHRNQIMIFQIG